MKKKVYVRLLRVIGAILPPSYEKPFGSIAKKIRYFLAKQISDNIGNNVNIERGGYVLPDTVVGDNSSIGVNCEIAKGLTIGKMCLWALSVCFTVRSTNLILLPSNTTATLR